MNPTHSVTLTDARDDETIVMAMGKLFNAYLERKKMAPVSVRVTGERGFTVELAEYPEEVARTLKAS